MSIRVDADELIEFLDSLAKIDPITMGALVAFRFPCAEALHEHPTVQTDPESGVGLLGILNGYAGAFDEGPRKGWGPISAIVERDGRCSGFTRTENA